MWYLGAGIFNMIFSTALYFSLYGDDKLLLSEAFYFKLSWIINVIMTYLLWAPVFFLWWFIFFLRMNLFNSFFLATIKFGLAGPLFCYEAVVVLFVISLFLDDHYPSSKVSMFEGIAVTVSIIIVYGFTGFV